MPKPYSEDLRRRIIKYLGEGLIQRKIAKILMVSTSFVLRGLIQKYKETGNINPKKPVSIRPFKVSYEEVRKYVESNSDKTLKELCIL